MSFAEARLRRALPLDQRFDVSERALWEHVERGWMHGSAEFRRRLTDDLGVMDVGYNSPTFQTPDIDRLKKCRDKLMKEYRR